MRYAHCTALLALPLLTLSAQADITPHPLVTDGMVLQRGVACPIWGKASPAEKITWKLHLEGNPLQGETTASPTGEWTITLPRLQAGGPHSLTLQGNNTVTIKNILVGEVWICSGQSNMEWPLSMTANAPKDIAAANYPKIRLFTVKKTPSALPSRELEGRWAQCHPRTVSSFSAVGYFFGRDLHQTLNVPIGLINTSWGGTVAEAWTRREKLAATDSLKYLVQNFDKASQKYDLSLDQHLNDLEQYVAQARQARRQGKPLPPAPIPPYNPASNPNSPTVLYNGMIHPLQPFAFKGVIWYQGESNVGRAYEYRTLFPAMIESWREQWNLGDFPFLFVQLAPFLPIVQQPQESAWAELREAQLLTSQKVKNTAMAVITDVGDPADIHPRKKEPVGARLALAARSLAYGEKLTYQGPLYHQHKIEKGKILLSFTSVGKGLEARGGDLTGFTIAGKDRKWHLAKAEIQADKVVVWSEAVPEPIAVRYGWYNCPVVNLWNKDGLPASPFRTDHFPILTEPKK